MDVVRGGKAGGAAERLDARSIADGPPRRNSENRGYDQPMRTFATVVGALLIVAGLVWLAQGLNLPFAPRSFMTADRVWAFIGAVTIVAGVTLLVRSRARVRSGA
jgi:hypothetical protein